MVMEICQPRGLPDVKSQLDIILFGVEAPSRISTRFLVILEICLGSNYQQERGVLTAHAPSKNKGVCLVSVQSYVCQISFTTKGRISEPLRDR